jgi:hypothetical protein
MNKTRLSAEINSGEFKHKNTSLLKRRLGCTVIISWKQHELSTHITNIQHEIMNSIIVLQYYTLYI